jgi:hypothetical protein
MAASSHALLGPSSAKRWLSCTPSARLTESIEDTESVFAAEGTDAHALCEYKLRKSVGLPVPDVLPKLEYYSKEMEDYADDYVSFILELYEEAKTKCKDPLVLVEQYLDLEKYVPESFGTGDALIASDGTLYIIDYKYGKGVSVDAKENPQMKLYALGALEIFDCLYDIKEVSMTIYQPRLGNVSNFAMKKDDLYKWANEIVKPKAVDAFKGIGEFHCGAWCQFCKARATCRERANSNLKLASKDFADPPLLTDEEVEEVLGKVDELASWAEEVKAYALDEALKGKKWNGYKVVEGRSIRKYSNESEVAKTVEDAGFDPYEKKLLSITEMQKRIGKSKFIELLDKFVVKPQGKPTLVQESDKRPEFSTAIADFKPDNMEEN